MAPVETYSRLPSVLVRPTMHRLVEEGGMVFTAGLKLFERPAAVAGVVLDSAGRPFADVTVRLGGAPFRTTTDANGRFRMDSLPAGRFSVIAEHASYTQLGSFVADEDVELREAADATLSLRAPRTSELVERLCEGKIPQRDNGALRLHVIDSLTNRPLPSLRVWLRWTGRYAGSVERVETLAPTAVGGTESLTDAAGAVTFCDVPADVQLVFSAIRLDGKPAADSTFHRLGRKELKAATVRTVRPQ
jgi:hypothetical protein